MLLCEIHASRIAVRRRAGIGAPNRLAASRNPLSAAFSKRLSARPHAARFWHRLEQSLPVA